MLFFEKEARAVDSVAKDVIQLSNYLQHFAANEDSERYYFTLKK